MPSTPLAERPERTVSDELRLLRAHRPVVSGTSLGHAPRGRSILRALLTLLLAVAITGSAPAFLAGCGGGGDGGGGGGGASSGDDDDEDLDDEDDDASYEELQSAVEDLIEEVEDGRAGELFPDELEKAKGRAEKAKDYILAGDVGKAERQYKMARRDLEQLVEDAEEVAALIDAAKESLQEAEAAKTKADEFEAAVNAPSLYKDAVDILARAKTALDKGTEDDAKSAKGRLQQAIELFDQAATLAKDNATLRALALEEKTSMEEYRGKAKENGADTTAIDVWAHGESAERQANADFERGDFQVATTGYQAAKRQYIAALARVMDEAKIAAWESEQAEQREKLLAQRQQELEAERARREASSPGGPLPPGTGGGRDTGGGTTAGGDIPPYPQPGTTAPSVGTVGGSPLANCFAGDPLFDASNYPNELDSEDEAFLQEHLDKLTKLGAPTYDPDTGMIELDYSIGRLAKREINSLNTSERFIEWEDALQRSVATEDLSPETTFGLGGNTKGFVLFPVPFAYNVRVSYGMQILTMTGNGSFGIVTSFNPKKKTFFQTDFLNIGKMNSSGNLARIPAPDRYGKENANYWADKTRVVPWEVEFRMPHPKKTEDGPLKSSLFVATYDVGGENIVHGQNVGDSWDRGFVGVTWNQVKFRLRELKICGIIDKPAAVEMLREITGIKKGESSGDDDDDDEPEADVDPVEDI